MSKVKVVEVGVRDGLQNESEIIPTQTKYTLIKKLSEAGLKYIEVGAYVSPKWVPQMAGSDQLVRRVYKDQSTGKLPRAAVYSALVPNVYGMKQAMETPIKEIAIFGSASESFSQRNINCSISESFERFQVVVEMAKKQKIKVRGYLSMAFGCPYEGRVPQARVAKLVEKLYKLGVYEVSIGDTIGIATPKQVRQLVPKLDKAVGLKNVAMHFHDTRGTALANVLASLDLGVRTFDSSVGGLGGCPYAKGASGNLGTEDLVYMLHGMGYKTGVDVEKLVAIRNWIQKQVGHTLPSHVGRSGIIKGLP